MDVKQIYYYGHHSFYMRASFSHTLSHKNVMPFYSFVPFINLYTSIHFTEQIIRHFCSVSVLQQVEKNIVDCVLMCGDSHECFKQDTFMRTISILFIMKLQFGAFYQSWDCYSPITTKKNYIKCLYLSTRPIKNRQFQHFEETEKRNTQQTKWFG